MAEEDPTYTLPNPPTSSSVFTMESLRRLYDSFGEEFKLPRCVNCNGSSEEHFRYPGQDGRCFF